MKKIKQLEPWINKLEAKRIYKTVSIGFLTENLETKKFENSLKKITGSKHLICTSSGSTALFMALKIYNIGIGDEVIVPNLTYIASANAALLTGAKIVLSEVESKNYGLDFDKIDSLINKKTKAIIVCHLYGHSTNIKKLLYFKKKYPNILIIEDAAEALGCKYLNKHLGTIGDIGIISFFANKIITTGEGGAILTNNSNIFNKLKIFKNDGRLTKGVFIHDYFGFNFRFTDLQASIGNVQLTKLSRIINRKRKIFNLYKNHLKDIKHLKFKDYENNIFSNYWVPIIETKNKRKLIAFLNKKKIETREIFKPLNSQKCFKSNRKDILNVNGNFNTSKQIYNNSICLPSHYNLSNLEIFYIVKNIKFFLKSKNKLELTK